MITFNIQADNGNYYRGHKPSNKCGNCWSDEEDALVLTIEQAREIANAWCGFMKIIISCKSNPISNEEFQRELFCAKGGRWYDYKPKEKDESIKCGIAKVDSIISTSIKVANDKYEFQYRVNDYRIHVLRYGEPWLIIEKGHKAISALMDLVVELEEKNQKLKN